MTESLAMVSTGRRTAIFSVQSIGDIPNWEILEFLLIDRNGTKATSIVLYSFVQNDAVDVRNSSKVVTMDHDRVAGFSLRRIFAPRSPFFHRCKQGMDPRRRTNSSFRLSRGDR